MKYLKDIERFIENKEVFCGVDVHKHHLDLCYYCTGEVLERLRLSNSIDVVLSHTRRYYHFAASVHFVYEAGFSGYTLYRQLRSAGYDCIITPATRIPQMHDRVKTDKRDALKLATYHAKGLLREVYVPPLSVETDRQIVRLRSHYQKKVNRLKNQIKSHLHLYGKRWSKENGGYWSRRYLDWLSSLEFEESGLRYILDEYLLEYRFFSERLQLLNSKIETMSKKKTYHRSYNRLRSCKGIGLLTAMTYILELYEINRFASGDALGSYIGLTPSQYSSGEKIRLGHITREGNSRVRNALVESSWTVIRFDPFLRAKYDRIRSKGTNGKKAIVAVARSLAVRLRSCLLSDELYDASVC